MKQVMFSAALLSGLFFVTGCGQPQVYTIRDPQNQRSYQSLGEPAMQDDGTIAFKDVASHKSVVLQRYDIVGEQGDEYKFEQDWMHREKLVPASEIKEVK